MKHLLKCIFVFMFGACAFKNPDIILNWYVIKNDPIIVNEKLVKGALVDGKKSDNYTPLMIAAWMGNLEIVKLLIDSGASVNRVSHNGIPPLLFATIRNHSEVVEFLLEKGADPGKSPGNQLNAIQISRLLEYKALVSEYKNRGHMSDMKNRSERKTEEILSIIRVNTIGFKIIYDKHLHKRPGFRGKLELKYSIRPDGSIDQITLMKSTTNYRVFDEAIIQETKSWKFGRINSESNDVVTVPFTFSE